MIKAVFTAVLILSSFFINAQTVFTHIATTSNIVKHLTKIDHEAINNDENKLLFVTQVFSDHYNNHPFGVLYNNEKWSIQQENKVGIDSGSIYNILAIDASEYAFIHQTTAENSDKNWTTIDHYNCNDNPNAILLVTQNWKGIYNPKTIGIRYQAGKWQIFNQDRSEVPKGTNFNVLITTQEIAKSVGGKAFVFKATDLKTNEFFTHLSNLPYQGNDTKIFATQNSSTNDHINSHEIAVWNSGPNWTIYNKDRTNLPNNTKFNLLVLGGNELIVPSDEELEEAALKATIKPVTTKTNLIRFHNQSEYIASAVITYIHNGKLQKKTTEKLAINESKFLEIPAGVSDIKLTMQLSDILWVKIDEIDFGINSPNSCYKFLGTIYNASFNNNCEARP